MATCAKKLQPLKLLHSVSVVTGVNKPHGSAMVWRFLSRCEAGQWSFSPSLRLLKRSIMSLRSTVGEPPARAAFYCAYRAQLSACSAIAAGVAVGAGELALDASAGSLMCTAKPPAT